MTTQEKNMDPPLPTLADNSSIVPLVVNQHNRHWTNFSPSCLIVCFCVKVTILLRRYVHDREEVIQKNQSRVSSAFIVTLPVRPASGILYMEI
jgi:hypothetical protein